MLPNKILKEAESEELGGLLFTFFTKVRDMFEVKRQNNRNMCEFDSLLACHCPLPKNYMELKKDVETYLKNGEGSAEPLFERMYASESNYSSVYQLLKNVVVKVFPTKLLGAENNKILVSMLKQFISMKRY